MRKIVIIFAFLSSFLIPTIVVPTVAHAQAGGGAIAIAYQMYVTWKDGEAKKYYEYDGELMQDATIRALKKLKLPVAITKDVAPPRKMFFKTVLPDVKFGDYTISAGNNDRFRIKVIEVEPNITRVTVRVNTMGDKEYAELLYKTIDQQVNIVDFTTKKKVKAKKK